MNFVYRAQKLDECKLRALLEFIRFKIPLSISFISIYGYVLYAPPGFNLIFVALSAFFVTVVGYGYNNITDRKEDFVNRRKINQFAVGNSGLGVVITCFLLGAFFSFIISLSSFFIYLVLAVVGVAYSSARIKRYMLVKNLYTSFVVSSVYIFGALAAQSTVTLDVLHGYLFVAGFILTGTLIADLRDVEGDRNAGLRTISVAAGSAFTKSVVYSLMVILSVYALILNLSQFYILLPFFLLAAFFLRLDNYHASHLCCVYSIFTMIVWFTGIRYVSNVVNL